MAGGRFDKLVGKTRPGTYINFESGRDNSAVSTGTRGTVIIPLPKTTYGPAKQFIKLTNASPDAQAALFGFSIYDNDPNRQMLLIREALKRATTVYVYILTEGKAASAEIAMKLTEEEVTETAAAVSEAISKYLGAKENLTGCKLAYSGKHLAITLLGPVSEVKNTGAFDTLAALAEQGYTATIDGIVIKSGADFMGTATYAKLAALTEGGAAVEFAVTVGKDGEEEVYTATVEYPAESSQQAQADTGEGAANTNTLIVRAKYGGSRGNLFTVTLDANPLGGYDVIVHLDGSKVVEHEGLNTVEELIALDNPYVEFKGAGSLGEAVGTTLTGGTDEEPANMDITDFIDQWESVKFNTVCFPFDGEEAANVKQAALTKIKYMRDSMGKGVQVVMPNAPGMDYEGIINVTNSVSLDSDELTTAEACAWVAGATAGASNTESLTYIQYAGATAVVEPKSNEEAIAAINAGEFFFSINENDEVVVEYDINSLTTFADKKDKSYRKNRVIRVFDTFQEAVQLNFPPNKYDNEENGWGIMEGIGKTVLRQFEDNGAITNVSYDEDFLVDRESSVDDETYFNVGLQAVDSAEKLYFTITTR